MDPARVGVAVSRGVSIVCATCKRYWEGREKGLPEPKCTTKSSCGSPFAGMTFPQYDGPITDFARWCFVCGTTSDYGVRVQDSDRTIGMCRDHIRMLEELEPVGVNGKPVKEIVSSEGSVPRNRIFKVHKKTLSEAIAEVEAYYASKGR